MAAKEALLALLENRDVSPEELVKLMLASARKHHSSVQFLSKLAFERFSLENPNVLGHTVESHVQAIVQLSRELDLTQKDMRHKTRDVQQSTTDCATPNPTASRNQREDSEENGKKNGPGGVQLGRNKDGLGLATTQQNTVSTACLTEEGRTSQVTKHPSVTNHEDSNSAALLSRDLRHLRDLVNKLISSSQEERIEASDRERRLTRHINDLRHDVRTLTSALEEERRKNQERDEKLSKRVNDLKSRLASKAYPTKLPAAHDNEKSSTTVNIQDRPSKKAALATESPPFPDSINSETTSADKCSYAAATVSVPQEQVPEDEIMEGRRKTNSKPTTTNPARTKTNSQNDPRHARGIEEHTQTWQLVGKPSSNVLKGSARIKREVFFLGGISPECSLESVVNWCEQKNVKVATCRFLPSKLFGTKSARLSVSAEDASSKNIVNEDFWPKEITIRPWLFSAQQNPGEAQEINTNGI